MRFLNVVQSWEKCKKNSSQHNLFEGLFSPYGTKSGVQALLEKIHSLKQQAFKKLLQENNKKELVEIIQEISNKNPDKKLLKELLKAVTPGEQRKTFINNVCDVFSYETWKKVLRDLKDPALTSQVEEAFLERGGDPALEILEHRYLSQLSFWKPWNDASIKAEYIQKIQKNKKIDRTKAADSKVANYRRFSFFCCEKPTEASQFLSGDKDSYRNLVQGEKS